MLRKSQAPALGITQTVASTLLQVLAVAQSRFPTPPEKRVAGQRTDWTMISTSPHPRLFWVVLPSWKKTGTTPVSLASRPLKGKTEHWTCIPNVGSCAQMQPRREVLVPPDARPLTSASEASPYDTAAAP